MNDISPVAKEVISLIVVLFMFTSLLFIIWSMCQKNFKSIDGFSKPKNVMIHILALLIQIKLCYLY